MDMQVENGHEWIMDTMMDEIMDNAEIHDDGWISMYMIHGYLFRLVLDVNGYVWIHQRTILICK
jgi:hypothetical protein